MVKIQHVYKSKREDIIGQRMDSVYLREGEIDRRITSPAQELVHVGATLEKVIARILEHLCESDSKNTGASLTGTHVLTSTT